MNSLIENFDFWGQIEGSFDSVLTIDFLDNLVFNPSNAEFFGKIFLIILLASPLFIIFGVFLKITNFFTLNIK